MAYSFHPHSPFRFLLLCPRSLRSLTNNRPALLDLRFCTVRLPAPAYPRRSRLRLSRHPAKRPFSPETAADLSIPMGLPYAGDQGPACCLLRCLRARSPSECVFFVNCCGRRQWCKCISEHLVNRLPLVSRISFAWVKV